jgi:hypothetical protein
MSQIKSLQEVKNNKLLKNCPESQLKTSEPIVGPRILTIVPMEFDTAKKSKKVWKVAINESIIFGPNPVPGPPCKKKSKKDNEIGKAQKTFPFMFFCFFSFTGNSGSSSSKKKDERTTPATDAAPCPLNDQTPAEGDYSPCFE